jgi:hypothetical protein
MDGCTEFAGVKVVEQLDDCARAGRKKLAIARSIPVVAVMVADNGE